MSRSARAATLTAAATALAVAAAVPTIASAADAPLRSINFDQSGARTDSFSPLAVSSDGREVYGTILGETVIRDVAAGTTTPLNVGAPLYDVYNYPHASDDLRRFAFSTLAQLSPNDTNNTPDIYVYDRRTGTDTLVSADPVTHHLPPAGADTGAYDYAISRDGTAVEFTGRQYFANTGTPNAKPIDTQWRYDLSSKTLTKGPVGTLRTTQIDASGRVNVSSAGVTTGGKTFPLPNIGTQPAVVSADGTTVGYWGPNATRVTLQDTTTGAIRTVAAPTAIVKSSTSALRSVGPGGNTVVLSTIVARGSVNRYVFSSLDTRTGVNTQIGGDVDFAYGSPTPISPNLAFVATTTSLAQLGSLPLPGAEGPPVPTPPAASYAGVQDSMCTKKILGLFWTTYTQPYLSLYKTASVPGIPSAVRVDATITENGSTLANLTITTPGTTKNFDAGRFGGWSAHLVVTLSNGQIESYDTTVAPHGNPTCTS